MSESPSTGEPNGEIVLAVVGRYIDEFQPDGSPGAGEQALRYALDSLTRSEREALATVLNGGTATPSTSKEGEAGA